jgi:hypothetical protein
VRHPAGEQGLNTGVQDAVNLEWKLAEVVNQTSPESLLDTYRAERHPVAARVLRDTRAQIALRRQVDCIKALGETMSELLSMDEPRKRFAAMMSGLDIHYDLGEGHPLLGRRMSDLDLVTANGPLEGRAPVVRLAIPARSARRASCASISNVVSGSFPLEDTREKSRTVLLEDKGVGNHPPIALVVGQSPAEIERPRRHREAL